LRYHPGALQECNVSRGDVLQARCAHLSANLDSQRHRQLERVCRRKLIRDTPERSVRVDELEFERQWVPLKEHAGLVRLAHRPPHFQIVDVAGC
jgi:hypothetical protein